MQLWKQCFVIVRFLIKNKPLTVCFSALGLCGGVKAFVGGWACWSHSPKTTQVQYLSMVHASYDKYSCSVLSKSLLWTITQWTNDSHYNMFMSGPHNYMRSALVQNKVTELASGTLSLLREVEVLRESLQHHCPLGNMQILIWYLPPCTAQAPKDLFCI